MFVVLVNSIWRLNIKFLKIIDNSEHIVVSRIITGGDGFLSCSIKIDYFKGQLFEVNLTLLVLVTEFILECAQMWSFLS